MQRLQALLGTLSELLGRTVLHVQTTDFNDNRTHALAVASVESGQMPGGLRWSHRPTAGTTLEVIATETSIVRLLATGEGMIAGINATRAEPQPGASTPDPPPAPPAPPAPDPS